MYMYIYFICVYWLLQKTGNPDAQLTQQEIQEGIDMANEQTLEAIECELYVSGSQ